MKTQAATNIPAAIPASHNEDWGFYGTMGEKAAEAWPLAVLAIGAETGADWDSVRAFLDSIQGRFFADSVNGSLAWGSTLPAAIRSSIIEWMNWSVGRIVSHETGIPRGMPYLAGYVIHAGILAEDAFHD